MKYIRLSIRVSAWLSACILAVLPIVVAADFGGVLWWTQYVAALAILLAGVLAIPTAFLEKNSGLVRQHYLTMILLAWCAYAWLQTVPIFAGLAATLSNGSKVAYRDWIEPFMGPSGAPTFFPISLDPEQSIHSVAILAMVTCVVWTATQVFVTRQRIAMLLNVLAVGAAMHAAFGITRQVYPEVQVMGFDMGVHSFGCFVNRNNAAFLMNLGLASSLGLLAWRLAALTGLEVDDKNFEFNDLFSLTSDRDSLIGLLSASLCIAGLLVCGSRGGLVALVIGLLLAFGWVRQKRGSTTVPIVAAAIAICIALLLVPLNLSLTSVDRLDVFDDNDSSSLLQDERLSHWRTSVRTAKAHFPAGSGMGTYGYAYLPHQDSGSSKWFLHADNLWLEMLVEQGLVGLVLTLAVLFLWIRTLLRMINSTDPIDHGLRVSGWFMVGSVCASQLFDFGLIIPCSLFALAVYVSANIARATAAGLNVAAKERDLFPTKYSQFYGIGLTAIVILFAALGAARLGTDAEVEAITTHVKVALPSATYDEQKLNQLASQIRSAPRAESSPRLLDLLCKIEHAQARLVETAASNPGNATEANSAYNSTDIMSRRMQWYVKNKAAESDEESPASDQKTDVGPARELYQSVLEHSRQSLLNLPLGMEARTWQLYFDFVHQDPVRSEKAFSQLSQIYTGNPEMLMRLGKHAIASGNAEQSTRLWRRTLELSPKFAVDVLESVRAHPEVDLLAVLPSNSTVFRRVTRRLIDKGDATEAVLKRAATEIDCENCETKKEKANCHRLAADIAYELGDLDTAFGQLRKSIELTPTEIKLHLLYVQRYRAAQRYREARQAAQRARILFPDDKRFDRIIKAIAAKELEGLDESIDPVLEDPSSLPTNGQ